MEEVLIIWDIEKQHYNGDFYVDEDYGIFPASEFKRILTNIASVDGFKKVVGVYAVHALDIDDIIRECVQIGEQNRRDELLNKKFRERVARYADEKQEALHSLKKFENVPKFSIGDSVTHNGLDETITEIRDTEVGECYRCERGKIVNFRFGWELSKKEEAHHG